MAAYPLDLGVKLSLVGAAILNTYVAGTVVDAGRPPRFRLYVKLVGKAGTAISPVKVKVQASDLDDGSDTSGYFDVETESDSDEIAQAPLVEHSYVVGSASTVLDSLTVDGCYKHFRVLSVGAAAGAAGDLVQVSVMSIGPGQAS
jgi:hypothetical protein